MATLESSDIGIDYSGFIPNLTDRLRFGAEVQQGDSRSAIAGMVGTTSQARARIHDRNPHLILPGQVIRID